MEIFLTKQILFILLLIVLVKNIKSEKEPEAMIDRNKVALDIPSELLGSSASTTLKLSAFIGDLIDVIIFIYLLFKYLHFYY